MELKESSHQNLNRSFLRTFCFHASLPTQVCEEEQSVVYSVIQNQENVLNQDQGSICDLFFKFSLTAKTFTKLS